MRFHVVVQTDAGKLIILISSCGLLYWPAHCVSVYSNSLIHASVGYFFMYSGISVNCLAIFFPIYGTLA